jgi:hypothetical protein
MLVCQEGRHQKGDRKLGLRRINSPAFLKSYDSPIRKRTRMQGNSRQGRISEPAETDQSCGFFSLCSSVRSVRTAGSEIRPYLP